MSSDPLFVDWVGFKDMFLAVFDNSPEGFLDSLSFGMLALPDPKACTKYYGNFYFEPRKVALKKKKLKVILMN